MMPSGAAKCKQDIAGEPASASGPALRRALGPATAVAIVVGYVIGSGIFFKPGNIAADVGDFRIIITSWIAGGVLCLLGALSIAELAAMLPRSGGLYVYLSHAYGRPVAFLFGWNEILFARPASLGALAMAFVGSLMNGIGWHAGNMTRAVAACAVVATVAWLNILGVVWGGRVQNVTTAIKVGFLVLLACAPFVLLPFGQSPLAVENYAASPGLAHESSTAARFSIALLAVLWAYNGWHQVTPVAEEVQEPQRHIPRALVLGVGILTVVYVSVNFAYHGVLPMHQMAAARDNAAAESVRALFGSTGAGVMAAVIMCSTLGAINGNLLVTPRISFAMARDGMFFRQIGVVHERFRTPAAAVALQGAMGCVLVLASGVLVETVTAFRSRSVFAMLTDFVIFASSLFYVLGVLAVVVLRYRAPEQHRPYRTWGYPVVPLLFVGTYVWFLSRVYFEKPFEANTGLVLIGLGIPAYFAWTRRGAPSS